MSFNCSATFIFPPPTPFVGCGENTPGYVISLSPNVYWDLNSDTGDHTFTNSMGFVLEIGDTICVDGSGDVVSFSPCNIESQFLIDGTPITNPFPACPAGGLTTNLSQYLFDTYKIDASATITITDTISFRQIVITTTGGFHTIATLLVIVEDIPFFFFEAPFVCNRIRRRKRSGINVNNICPSEILVSISSNNVPTYIDHLHCGKFTNPVFVNKNSQGMLIYKYTK